MTKNGAGVAYGQLRNRGGYHLDHDEGGDGGGDGCTNYDNGIISVGPGTKM